MKRPNILQQVAFALVNPGRNFAAIREKPFYLVPLAFVILGALVVALAAASALSAIDYGSLGNLSAQDIAQVERVMDSPLMRLFTGAGAVVGSLFSFFFRTLLLWAFIRMFKGRLTFGQTLAVVGIAHLPLLARDVLSAVQTYANPDLMQTALDSVTDMGAGEAVAGVFRDQGLVFQAWNLFLVTWGLSVVAGVSKVKAALVVVGYWVVGVALAIANVLISLQLTTSMGM